MEDFEISTDVTRLEVDYLHRALNTTYWAAGRSREMVERTIAHSLCFGVYVGTAQVGFARVVTDRTIFGYLMDVYVDPGHRGRGIGKALIAAILEHPELRDLNLFMLRTRDAQPFYRQFGFEEVNGLPATMARHRVSA
jgi:GNAT superfamily N-acetyltransferase